MCFFGGSKSVAPAPEPPALPEKPPVPGKVTQPDGKVQDIAVKAQEAKKARKRQLVAMAGAKDTVRTGPRGIIEPPEDVTYKKLLGT